MSSATLILSAFGDEVKRLDSSSGRVVLGRASAFTADRNAAFDNGTLVVVALVSFA